MLRKIVIYINHCENGSKEQASMRCDLQSVAIELFVVAEIAHHMWILRLPRQELLEAAVTLSKYPLV